MINTRTKTKYIPQKAKGKQSLNVLDVLSVKRRIPDYRGYSAFKREIENMPLLPEEYEALCKRAAERYGL